MSALSKLTDQELTVMMAEDSELAFIEIYNRYKGILYQHAYKILKNQEEADDIIQELFTSLWAKKNGLEFKSNLSGYLYTAVRNRVLDFISRTQVQSAYITSLQSFIDEGTAITDHKVRLSMLREIIEKEISNLPPKMREVFELSRKHQLSNKEIALKLSLSEKTVKNQVNNALKILRMRLGLIIYLFLLFKIR